MSLAGWIEGVWFVPVTLSDSEGAREKRRVAAQIKDWKRQFAERQAERERGRWGETGWVRVEEREGEKARLTNVRGEIDKKRE